jgi:hypothetical protein
MSLFKLSSDFFLALFNDWLNLKDFCRFDTAICVENTRSNGDVLPYLKSTPFSRLVVDCGDALITDEWYGWLDKRRFSLVVLKVNCHGTFVEKMSEQSLNLLLKFTFDKIYDILDIHLIQKVLKHATLLVELCIIKCTKISIERVLQDILTIPLLNL